MGALLPYLSALFQHVLLFWTTVVLSLVPTVEMITKKKILFKPRHWWGLAALAFLWTNFAAWNDEHEKVLGLQKIASATPAPQPLPQVVFQGISPVVDTLRGPGRPLHHPLLNIQFVDSASLPEILHLYWKANYDVVYDDTSPRNRAEVERLNMLVESDITEGKEYWPAMAYPGDAIVKSLVLGKVVSRQEFARYENDMDGIFYAIAIVAEFPDHSGKPAVFRSCGYGKFGFDAIIVDC